MKNLFNLANIDDATISVNFKPELSSGFKEVRGDYWLMYENGDAAYINIQEGGFKISKRDLMLVLFPESSDNYVNADFLNVGTGRVNLFLETLFIAEGLHVRNATIASILHELVTVIQSDMLPIVELNGEEVALHGNNPDYCFKVVYVNTKQVLRIFNIPRQGYIDIEFKK